MTSINTRGEMLCAWAGVIGMSIFLGVWVFSVGWLLPPSPSLDATEITKVYADNVTGIRIGMTVVTNIAIPLVTVFGCLFSVYLLRLTGSSPVFAWINVAMAAVQLITFIVAMEAMAATSYRLDRVTDVTQFGNDFGWFMFDNVVGPTQVQLVSIALAIFYDKAEKPLFPRSFAYFCVWAATIMLVNNLIIFFKSGPFAWNGLLGWWPGAGIYCLWYFVAFFLMRNAIKRFSLEK